MGENSSIEWTDHTFNPWIGCTKVSDGCKNCYAEAQDKRWRKEPRWGPKAARERTGESYWKQPARWDRDAKTAGVRRRVFCASLADVFDDHPSIEQAWRDDLWRTIAATPSLDWLLLTKRPELISVPWQHVRGEPPWPNVRLGTTVEDQEQARKRIPWLLGVPAAVRFLSVEPQIGPVDLSRIELVAPVPPYGPGAWLNALTGHVTGPDDILPGRIGWVICGGESGRGARPFNVEWARSLRDQCAAARVPFFCKQLGANPRWEGRDALEPIPALQSDPKGGDWSEWPADLRVREFPEVRR
jgi:protein gp37